MKRPWWQDPRSWHDSWGRALLGYAMLFLLLMVALLATAALVNRSL